MRLYIILTGVLVLMTSFSQELFAQSLKRSVIASTGGSFSNSQFRIASTIGQPPNPGTVLGPNGVYLRQGFQQPPSAQDGSDENCGFSASFDIDVQDQGVCGTFYSFMYTGTADPDLQYLWDFGEGAMPPTSSDMNPAQIAYATTGLKTIVLQVTRDSCTEFASRIIDVSQVGYGVLAIGSDVQCYGDGSGSIELQVYNGQAPYQYSWSNDPAVNTEKQYDLEVGDYHFTVTDANGCSFVGAENIEGPANPLTLAIDYQDEACIGTSDGEINVDIAGGTFPYTLEWSNGSAENQLSGLAAGTYSLTVTDDNACVVDTLLTLIVFCQDGDDGIPDVISPNGDGKNDVWVIPGIENYPDNEVFIFNRWGATVYSMKSYMNTWSGTNSNGEPLQVGAYYYLIELNDEFDTRFSGSITIIR